MNFIVSNCIDKTSFGVGTLARRVPETGRTVCPSVALFSRNLAIAPILDPPPPCPAVESDLLHPRQRSLIASLQLRFRLAEQKGDAKAKQALFREAIHLGIQPHLFTDSP